MRIGPAGLRVTRIGVKMFVNGYNCNPIVADGDRPCVKRHQFLGRSVWRRYAAGLSKRF